jgi:hypothetical protein
MWSSADGSVYVVTIDEDDMNEDDGDNAVLQVAPPVAR